MKEKVNGVFQRHVPCPECNSKDNLHVYLKTAEDGETYVDGYCPTCENSYKPPALMNEWGYSEDYDLEFTHSKRENEEKVMEMIDDITRNYPVKGFKSRRIKRVTSDKYGVKCDLGDEGDPTAFYFPCTKDGVVIGYKMKPVDKVDGKYNYKSIGSYKTTDELFGQHLFSSGGKYLVITEGQEDAMAFYEALTESSGGKYETPVVSINNGVDSVKKQFAANYDFITSFEKVIIAFDNDPVGRKATEEACKLLKPGQAFIAKFNDFKDACDYKKNNRDNKLVDIFWRAERYSPIDICSMGSLWDEFATAVDDEIIELPSGFGELRDMMGGGPAQGEVTVIGALTSIGKSTILNNIVYNAIVNQGKKAGLMYLESSGREIVRSFLSIHSKTNLALKQVEGTDLNKLKSQFDEFVGDDSKLMVVNHQGAFTSIDDMTSKLRWMAKAGDCDLIVVDPLQAAVPDNTNDMLDKFMDSMLKLAKETNTSIIVVSHMRKPENKDAHAVDEYSLKGSSSINQIAFNTILLSRDKTSDSELVRNTTKLTLVKCRRTGNTGNAGWIRYNHETTELYAATDPYNESEMLAEMDELEYSKPNESTGDSTEWEFRTPN